MIIIGDKAGESHRERADCSYYLHGLLRRGLYRVVHHLEGNLREPADCSLSQIFCPRVCVVHWLCVALALIIYKNKGERCNSVELDPSIL